MTLILSGTNGLSDVDGDASTPAIRGSDSNTGIFFGTDIIGFSEGGTEAMRINADAQIVAAAGTASLPVITTTGDVNTGIFFPAADTIAFTTGGTTRGRWTTDGLCFNADTAAANALDDYEEGTWTPVGTFTTQGTATSSSSATYTKIGRQVTIVASITINKGTASGTFTITGVPFATATTCAVAIRTAGIGAALTVLQANLEAVTGTVIKFLLAPQSTSLAGAVPTAAEMNAPDSYIQLSCTYSS